MEIYRRRPPKEKRPSGREPKFTIEYMTMVARKVADEGMTYDQACKTFGISQGAVGDWKKRYLKGTLGSSKSDTHEQSSDYKVFRLEDQVKDLKREIGELYLENMMLKKTLCTFPPKKKESSSVITSENLEQFKKGAKK